MFPLVEFPELVQHYAPFFASMFTEKAFVQFQRYLSGLIVSENKTVEGINRLFAGESESKQSEPTPDREPFFDGSLEPSPIGAPGKFAWDANETQRCAQCR